MTFIGDLIPSTSNAAASLTGIVLPAFKTWPGDSLCRIGNSVSGNGHDVTCLLTSYYDFQEIIYRSNLINIQITLKLKLGIC